MEYRARARSRSAQASKQWNYLGTGEMKDWKWRFVVVLFLRARVDWTLKNALWYEYLLEFYLCFYTLL